MKVYIYLALRFFRAFGIVALSISALILLIDGVEQLRFLASRQIGGISEAIVLTIYRYPGLLQDVLPLLMLIAAMVLFMGLARTSELVIFRASGMSALKILTVPMLCVIFIGVMVAGPLNGLLVEARVKADQFKSELRGFTSNTVRMTSSGIWVREEDDPELYLLYASTLDWQTRTLSGVDIFIRNAEADETRRLNAQKAVFEDGTITLSGLTSATLTNGSLSRDDQDTLTVPMPRSFEDIFGALIDPSTLPVWQLPAYLAALERAGFRTGPTAVTFYSELARPALYVSMFLIGSMFSFASQRGGGTAMRVFGALSVGFGLYALIKLGESLGRADTINYMLASFGPAIAGALVSLVVILHLEDG